MKIAVLGTFLKDRIIGLDGKVTESKGGLFYSIEALRAICGENDEIIPISYVGNDFYEQVFQHFKDDRRVNLTGLYRHEGANNCVELRYFTAETREERSLNPMPPLTAKQLAPFAESDVFVANFISGWEMELNEFRSFGSQFKGLSLIDIHSLTLERLNNGLRRYRKLADAESWIEYSSIVQFNEAEFRMLTSLNVLEFYKLFCFDQNKIVNLTLDKHGSLHIYRKGAEIKKYVQKPERKVKVIDPTGCGDVFLAGFAYFYAFHKDVRKAAQKATSLAAAAGSHKGLPEVSVLVEKFNQIVG